MDKIKKQIRQKLIANVISETLAQSGHLIFREAWCTQERVLRKGAISAHKGEKILIPLNMRDGCILAIGKGNPEWNESAPHGAGRLMSRAAAKNTLDMNAYAEAMSGIYTTSVNRATLDEAPMAYKPKEAIINALAETADIQEILKPVYNFKASE